MKEIKINITRRKLIALGLVFVVLVGAVIGWIVVRPKLNTNSNVDKEIENAQYPFFPEQYYEVYMTPDNSWKIKNFQPIVTGFEDNGTAQYILAKYKDYNGDVRTIKIYTTGAILDQPGREKIGLQETEEVSKQVTFTELKDIVKKGDQIDVLYLAEFTISQDIGDICVGKEDLCAHSSVMGRIYNDLQSFVTNKTAADGFVLPAFSINLVNETKESNI
ncbi:hypothetical protein H6764_01535 [Candidatus Nomurabacteria bacterium]|nr:hypothetical protein [Candidatus Nomurabacteria bacterium]